jgi:hypothetical protein
MRSFEKILSARFLIILTQMPCLLSLSSQAADVTVTVNASSFIRAIPETMYGTNTMTWDGKQNGGNDNFNNLMAASGRRYIRWPGGSWGNVLLWSDVEGPSYSYTWKVNYDESMYMINKMGGIMQPIVNFPGYWYDTDHSDAEAYAAAAALVRDQSSRIPCARYWEIGNEIGGSWEAGWFATISGTYYGNQYSQFYQAMKAVNPQIKLGACSELKPWFYVGYWTYDTLQAAYANGIIPDYLIIHQYPGSDQAASYNPTLLSSNINEIASFTTSMNNIITSAIGSQYVGKIKYWMTEWNTGGISPDPANGIAGYQRWQAYVNAMFQTQYILEMAKNGWEGSNPWNQSECNNSTYDPASVYPVWYISPLLSNRFGRDMVTTSSTDSKVRVYASRDEANNLTIIIVNNYPTTDRTVSINISGFNAGTNSERWLIEPAGSMITGGVNIQDYGDVAINGITHPNPLTFNALSGVSITTGSSFDISLARSRIMLIKIPLASPVQQSSYSSVPWTIPGTIEAEDYDTGGKFTANYDTTSGNSAGQYRSDDVDIETCGEGGYDVTGTQVGEWLEYTVDVESSGIYQVSTRVASAGTGGQFRIEFDGQDITGPVSFAATGGAQTYTNVDVNRVFIQKGQHTMRLLIDTAGWNINWISFAKVGGGIGSSLREVWTGVSGSTVSNLTSNANYPNNPTGRELSKSFEGPTGWSDTYGTRIRGYLHPTTSGSYTFWIASDDNSELWLSTTSSPANKVKIASVTGYTNEYQWDKYPSQKSSVKSLVAGQSYYIEALHKEGSGGDSVAVAWEGPEGSGIIQQAITGAYLSPWLINFQGDYTGDNLVNLNDLNRFLDMWLYNNCTAIAGFDLDENCTIDLYEFSVLAQHWLETL